MSKVQSFLIGQRVIVGREIGTITYQPKGAKSTFDHWVYLPSRGYESNYADGSVKPLPNGQL